MPSIYGPLLLICNPRAGSGSARRDVAELQRHLDARAIEHEVAFTKHPGHASEIARTALKDGRRFLVAVGGDGTIHEVVNGMIEDDVPVRADAVLGVAAAGTASDFIKTFGIPALPAHAAVHLDGPESFAIDIGKVTYESKAGRTTRYFCNVAEAGLGALVARRASSLPHVLGPLLYPLALWLALMSTRKSQVKVDLVDRSYEGPMFNLVVANGQFFGSGMKIAPRLRRPMVCSISRCSTPPRSRCWRNGPRSIGESTCRIPTCWRLSGCVPRSLPSGRCPSRPTASCWVTRRRRSSC